MQTFLCENKCCVIKIKPYVKTEKYYNFRSKRCKAGVFIYDPHTNKILLVQSNGNLWGPPKGTLQNGETYQECAIREVREETGINVNQYNFSKKLTIINNNAIYYYMEYPKCNLTIDNNVIENDATGITWISPYCLEHNIKNGNITITRHCKLLLYYFLNILHSRYDYHKY